MPSVVGGLAALVALAAGILGHVDPLDTLFRAAVAFMLGVIGTQAWYVFFATRSDSPEKLASLHEKRREG